MLYKAAVQKELIVCAHEQIGKGHAVKDCIRRIPWHGEIAYKHTKWK